MSLTDEERAGEERDRGSDGPARRRWTRHHAVRSRADAIIELYGDNPQLGVILGAEAWDLASQFLKFAATLESTEPPRG